MNKSQQEFWGSLGVSEDAWNNKSTEIVMVCWNEFSSEEILIATSMCFTEQIWDDMFCQGNVLLDFLVSFSILSFFLMAQKKFFWGGGGGGGASFFQINVQNGQPFFSDNFSVKPDQYGKARKRWKQRNF